MSVDKRQESHASLSDPFAVVLTSRRGCVILVDPLGHLRGPRLSWRSISPRLGRHEEASSDCFLKMVRRWSRDSAATESGRNLRALDGSAWRLQPISTRHRSLRQGWCLILCHARQIGIGYRDRSYSIATMVAVNWYLEAQKGWAPRQKNQDLRILQMRYMYILLPGGYTVYCLVSVIFMRKEKREGSIVLLGWFHCCSKTMYWKEENMQIKFNDLCLQKQ